MSPTLYLLTSATNLPAAGPAGAAVAAPRGAAAAAGAPAEAHCGGGRADGAHEAAAGHQREQTDRAGGHAKGAVMTHAHTSYGRPKGPNCAPLSDFIEIDVNTTFLPS